MKNWNFITNHGLVLLYISRNQQCTMREIATAIGVTERSVQRLLKDLEVEGYVTWQGTGKGNIYRMNHTRPLRHELTKDSVVRDLLSLLEHAKNHTSEKRS